MLFFIICLQADLFAATCNSQSGTLASPASWSSAGTWSCGNVPVNNDNVNISHYVSAGNLSISFINQIITINAGGTLRINGDLLLEGNNVQLILNGGTLEVTGNLTVNNRASITANSGNISVTGTVSLTNNSAIIDFNSSGTFNMGSFTSPSGSTKALNMNSGTLNVTNTMTISSGTTVFIDDDATMNVANITNEDASSSILNNEGIVNVSQNISISGPINNLSTGTMNITGNLTAGSTGNALFSNYGDLNLTGNGSFPDNASFEVHPGGVAIVSGDFTVSDTEGLVIGTAVAPPEYADMVIRGNLNSSSSGDVLIDQNGRVAVFGDIIATGSGTTLTLNAGGQIYVDGNGSGDSVTFPPSSGSEVENNNPNITYNGNSIPYGFYVNGTIGGASGSSDPAANVSQLQGSNVPFYNWILSHSNGSYSTLPVSLIFFHAKNQSGAITIEWATAMERNFDEFILERSSNGTQFYEIARLKGSGNSNTKNEYAYQDNLPIIGRVYYRLSALDFDGYIETFRIIKADYDSDKKINMFPIPVSFGESLSFVTNFEPSSYDRFEIINDAGVSMYRGNPTGSSNVFQVNTDLKPGIYSLLYHCSGTSLVVRFTVE